jgi:hypothetical protein
MKKQPKSRSKKPSLSTPPKDLTGKRFGKWVVQEYAGEKNHNRIWFCRCDCGVQNNVFEGSLIHNTSTQCLRCSWIKRSKDRTPSLLQQKHQKSKEQAIIGNKMLMKIRKAKTREEMIRCMVAARKAGYKYEMIGIAAGLSRQRVHIIVTKHLGK